MATPQLSRRTLSDPYLVLKEYRRHLLNLLENGESDTILDLGCGSGTYTAMFAEHTGSRHIVGLDIDSDALRFAKKKGIEVLKADLDSPLPFPDGAFKTVVSSQVIEHLQNPDSYAREIHRVLAPDGYAVIATENLAAWHNVLSLFLGYQPFTENISAVRRIGNPFAPNYGRMPCFDNLHVRVFTYCSFLEFFEVHDFKLSEVKCSGYPPIPHPLSRIFSRLDPRHARYMIVKIRKRRSKF